MARVIEDALRDDNYTQEGIGNPFKRIIEAYKRDVERTRRNIEIKEAFKVHKKQTNQTLNYIVENLSNSFDADELVSLDNDFNAIFNTDINNQSLLFELTPVGIYEDFGVKENFVDRSRDIPVIGYTSLSLIDTISYYRIDQTSNPEEIYEQKLDDDPNNYIRNLIPPELTYLNPPVEVLDNKTYYQLLIILFGDHKLDSHVLDPHEPHSTVCALAFSFDEPNVKVKKEISKHFSELVRQMHLEPWKRSLYHEFHA